MPDGRVGVVLEFMCPAFFKDRDGLWKIRSLTRISQNVPTCPTTRCFSTSDSPSYFRLGRKIAYFGDGYEERVEAFGRKMWKIPTMAGIFLSIAAAAFAMELWAATYGSWQSAKMQALKQPSGQLPPSMTHRASSQRFPVESPRCFQGRQPLQISIRQHLRSVLSRTQASSGSASLVPDGVKSIMEIIINGHDLEVVAKATHAAIRAAKSTAGLLRISAGNYGGRLGKSFIYLER